ncbi:hypothetical protein OCU04_002116 [Sclerotinia nivalis]|uniref:Glucose-methanol-choline oxidoreductase N-terminal domain-containing protein n=1 Tax=Sclerotinia nivalis TaxID=352851 RepID=A0A9X0AZH7_9HELO|nr:hypothetical protein OCU04_002116 [Sclerotinia nivalis]
MSATSTPSSFPPNYLTSTPNPNPNTYDFIIIGGGTSSLVVATRLTQDPSIHVLVLEAGSDHSTSPTITTPGLWPANLGTETDWGFLSEHQKPLSGKRIHLSQGRLLGGSTAINGGAFIANSKFSIDAWASLGHGITSLPIIKNPSHLRCPPLQLSIISHSDMWTPRSRRNSQVQSKHPSPRRYPILYPKPGLIHGLLWDGAQTAIRFPGRQWGVH